MAEHTLASKSGPALSSSHFRPSAPAHIVRTDAEAIEIAERLAIDLAKGAAERDRERRLPFEEIDTFSQSGLWAITIPKAYGGAEVSCVTLAEVIKIIAAADPSIGQIPQNHFSIVDLVRISGTEEQRRYFFAEVLKGLRLGNAFSERKTKNVAELKARLSKDGDTYVVTGTKFYSTGALFAHRVPVAGLDQEGRLHVAIADRNAPGLKVVDDWSSFGQRTTASGTVSFDEVRVPADHVIAAYRAFEVPTANGPHAQLVHAAIDLGIATAAIQETTKLVRTQARPWIDSGQQRASDDPYTIAQIGDLHIRLRAAEALLARGGGYVDKAIAAPTEDSIGAASIAVAEAKVLSTELAILATNKLFELSGTSSTLEGSGLDRHCRNARVHTLHDPVRWKYFAVGNFYLNDVLPQRHPWI
ncbi:MAG TPA: SfnB family sulfur acquisition oxidoreductase [Xanthobacteraceae bacterium]|jgi:SfnB family sulfur acquisition oxidoreductase